MRITEPDPVTYYRYEIRRLREQLAYRRDETAESYENILEHVEHELDVILDNAPKFDGVVAKPRAFCGRDQLVETIIDVVSRRSNINSRVITGPRRTASAAHARHLAMYLIHRRTTLTFSEIGRFFGGKDHSSVIHAVQKVRRMHADNSNGVKDDVEAIEAQLASEVQ